MKEFLLKLLLKRPWSCAICGAPFGDEIKKLIEFYEWPRGVKRPLGMKRKKINIDVDHIMPRSEGGLTELFNLQIAHSTCNNKKGSRYKGQFDELLRDVKDLTNESNQRLIEL